MTSTAARLARQHRVELPRRWQGAHAHGQRPPLVSITSLVACAEADNANSIVPYGSFKTEDGYIMIGAGNDGQFAKLATLLGASDWATDGRFKSNALRVANREQLKTLVEAKLAQHPTAEWLERFK